MRMLAGHGLLSRGMLLRGHGLGGLGEDDPTLAFAGNPFPVTLKRSASRYYVAETGANWLANYTGATLTVGPVPAAYTTLDTAIAAASDGDVISIAPGEYAFPSLTVTKDLAFVAPSGAVYIGTYQSLAAATITTQTGGNAGIYTVAATGLSEKLAGFCRKTEKVNGTRGSSFSISGAWTTLYRDAGIQTVYVGSSASNVTTGSAETLQSLIAAGSIMAWTIVAGGSFAVTGADVYVGPGITMASYLASAVVKLNSGLLILDETAVFGGADSVISVPGTGTILQFGTDVTGSRGDNIDYRGTVIAVEVGITSLWPGIAAADNATTGHDNAQVLRVGGDYGGGSRVVHDVAFSKSYIFSSRIRAPMRTTDERWGVAWGFPGHTQAVVGAYGDLTFEGTFGAEIYIDPTATVQQIELSDPWTLG